MLRYTTRLTKRLPLTLLAMGWLAVGAAPATAATTILVNFDTPKMVDVSMDVVQANGVTRTIRFRKTTTPSGLSAQVKADTLAVMNAAFAGTGVTLTTDPNVAHTKEIDFTGGRLPAPFNGLAGLTNKDLSGAWVYTGVFGGIPGITALQLATALGNTGAHELGHSLGLPHRWDGTLMTEGPKYGPAGSGKPYDILDFLNTAIVFSADDAAKITEANNKANHGAGIAPGNQFSVQGFGNEDDLFPIPPNETDPIGPTDNHYQSDLFFFDANPGDLFDLETYDFGVVMPDGEFIGRGRVGHTAGVHPGDDRDVFGGPTGENFDFALRDPGSGVVFSEATGSLVNRIFDTPNGSGDPNDEVNQGAFFQFDLDGDEEVDAFVDLVGGEFGLGGSFRRGCRGGDFNCDGLVTANDFFTFQETFQQPGEWSRFEGDANGDHMVTEDDFFIFQQNFDGTPVELMQVNAIFAQLNSQVPEPATALLLGTGLLLLNTGRQRRRSRDA